LFTATDIVTWNLKSIGNPEFGESRTAESLWDFDDTDFDAFTDYNWFTNKWQFFLYDTTSTVLQYELKSYDNLNAAYLGYYQAQTGMNIGSFDPQDKSGRIIV